MVNAEIYLPNSATLQLLLIPDTTVHELPPTYSPYAFTSPKLVPGLGSASADIDIQSSGAPSSISEGDIGLRYRGFKAGWDYTVNYFNHLVDAPVFQLAMADQPQLSVMQTYERSHLYGFSASTVFGAVTFRLECAYEQDRWLLTNSLRQLSAEHDTVTTALGWDLDTLNAGFFSWQWFQKSILSYDDGLVEDKRSDTVTLLWRKAALHDTLVFEWLEILNTTEGDGVSRPNITYNYLSNVDVIISADIFHGKLAGLFGQFDAADRVTLGLSIGF